MENKWAAEILNMIAYKPPGYGFGHAFLKKYPLGNYEMSKAEIDGWCFDNGFNSLNDKAYKDLIHALMFAYAMSKTSFESVKAYEIVSNVKTEVTEFVTARSEQEALLLATDPNTLIRTSEEHKSEIVEKAEFHGGNNSRTVKEVS